MRTFLCDRKIPNTNRVVVFSVEALNGSEAAFDAQELAYAVAWHKGLFPKSAKHPLPWAKKATFSGGQR